MHPAAMRPASAIFEQIVKKPWHSVVEFHDADCTPILQPGSRSVGCFGRSSPQIGLSSAPHCCREEVLATLGAVSDFSFSWGLMDRYTSALQAQARSFTFHKLSH